MGKYIHRILFVITDHYKSERLGIEILSSIALEEGYSRKLLVLNLRPLEHNIEMVEEFQPEIIAYSAMTFEHYDLQRFNRILKQAGLKFISIFGGNHYTFNPEEIIKDTYIDVICRGEGEKAFRNFIQCIRDGKEYYRIEKLWVRGGTEVFKNPIGMLIKDLDTGTFADRELMISSGYNREYMHGKNMSIMIGRGCPHHCSYCSNDRYNKLFKSSYSYNHRSVDNVIKELKFICEKYQPNFIVFRDDSISYLHKDFIENFCWRYKKEINKPFGCMLCADLVKEDILIILKGAGVYLIAIGIECASEELTRTLLCRKPISKEDIKKAFALLHKHKIKTCTLNLVGLPVGDPLKVDWETIKFNMQLSPTWTQFSILQPIPKTAIFDYVVEKGYLDVKDFFATSKIPSCLTRTPLKFKSFSIARQINNLHKFASVLVKSPFLLPLVKILIVLPLTNIYQYMFLLWYGYWKSIGFFETKFSFRLVFNGIKEIHRYLKKHR